ncbi:MAG TPA: hypothetical protein DCS07_13855, partial [Bdellovibrionales bacterium]|nr:hypothetical protein [Bdellovibrionales bacterium]
MEIFSPENKLKGICSAAIICLFSLSGSLGQAGQATRERPPFKPIPVCSMASVNDDILADGLGHNSFDPQYRSPFGAVTTEQGSVTLRFRTCLNDVTQVRIRIWNSVEKRETWLVMKRQADPKTVDPSLGPVEFWDSAVSIPNTPALLYYFFEVTDTHNTHYYIADTSPIGHGGWGRFSEHWDDYNTYGITVYSKNFHTPDWFKGSVMYQILPDRFRNGDPSNDPVTGQGFVFGKPFIKMNWDQAICDPRGPDCNGQQDNQFYGGDLQGVLDQLEYLKNLGVKILYFNPVFLSATNHRYDTQDYFKVDPKLGSMELFERLSSEAEKRDMKIILDGVFNHGSADSPYFDIFRRWGGVGACESVDSIYRSWFYFPHFAMQPVDHARPGTFFYCTGPDETLTTYEAWWSYYEHPVYRKNSPVIRDFFFTGGPDAVGPYWIRKGAGGWRLDVAGDVAPGEGVDPTNDFWQGFRTSIKAQDPDAVIIGEEWTNASPWLLGREWDSATNYRFRTLLLDWLADRCQGLGCSNGRVFQDNDNNNSSSNGPITPIDEREFDRRLRVIEQDTPPEAWHALMNPLGSHDTQRVQFLLKKISGDDATAGRRKLFLAALFQFTYPGVP